MGGKGTQRAVEGSFIYFGRNNKNVVKSNKRAAIAQKNKGTVAGDGGAVKRHYIGGEKRQCGCN